MALRLALMSRLSGIAETFYRAACFAMIEARRLKK
jgi:hypothetical protein